MMQKQTNNVEERIKQKADEHKKFVREFYGFESVGEITLGKFLDDVLETLKDYQQKQKQAVENFDVVAFLERHNVKFDEWLKMQFFELVQELEKELQKQP